MKTSKKTIWSLVVLLIMAVAAGGFLLKNKKDQDAKAAQKKDDNYVLRLADPSGVCGAPQQIAAEKGFFKKAGLKYKTVKLSPDTNGLEATTSNKVDASNSLLGSVVQPLSNGAQIKITTGLHTGCISILTGKNSQIKSAKDLVGKKIGVAQVAGSEATFAKRYLSDHGVNVSDKHSQVEFTQYSGSELPLALEKGQVDAIAIEDPDVQIAQQKYGFNALANSAKTKPFNTEYCCVAYVSEKLAKDHPAVARKYTQAMQEATRWVAKHREETAQIQIDKKYAPGEKSINVQALDFYNWKASYNGAQKAFKQVGNSLQKAGVISKDVDIDSLARNSFLNVETQQ
ncbi:nitrate/sulfonate/bicarbonate ABC transporter, substrate-binding protein [Ligilactobacillus salitolerans]|uniref:Nitrate/sulfonate/bicarbonate ABC transporter, substrate-binding protein n=1 Tax=Ligilactobacillus salitolerans TaxID=1808352 RepID=A0A401IWB3_9LACO|nr:ABC transporter substrate-binding protein [Ligilactobacillus salitolerans]GBG95795.1 nitrate/sulfonate/bicarbonate ABC transporter, substrate-binding protein [Ligilactobacillus salitolerans]